MVLVPEVVVPEVVVPEVVAPEVVVVLLLRTKSVASAGGTGHQKAACAPKLERCQLAAHSCQQAENTGSSPPRRGERESNEAGDHTDKEARSERGHVEAHLPRRAGEGVQ